MVTFTVYDTIKFDIKVGEKMKTALFLVFGIVIVMQFIRVDFKNPVVDENVALHTNPQVMSVLKTSCYDCHSSETKYPWYHDIAPVSWIMSDNITRGRKALDFSNWANIDPKVKLERLEHAKKLINNDGMPKHDYLLMHKNATLNEKKKRILEQFFDLQIKELTI